jgi:hypothetical protein
MCSEKRLFGRCPAVAAIVDVERDAIPVWVGVVQRHLKRKLLAIYYAIYDKSLLSASLRCLKMNPKQQQAQKNAWDRLGSALEWLFEARVWPAYAAGAAI